MRALVPPQLIPGPLRRGTLLVMATVLAAPLFAIPAQAQNQNPMREQLRCAGKIQGIAGAMVQFTTTDGEQWVVGIEGGPNSVQYVADADASWLQPGMLVEFRASLTKKGEAVAPLTSISVISPRMESPIGIRPDEGGLAGLAGGELFADPKEEAPKPGRPGRPKADESIPCHVVGQITGIKDGEIWVAAGNGVAKAPVAENATVAVSLASLQLARVGDQVEVVGWYPPGRKGQGIATQVHVRAAEKLKIEPPKRRVRGRPVEGDKPADGEKSAEGEKPADGAKPANE